MPVPQNRRFVTEDDLEIYVKSDSIADVVRQDEIADVVRDAELEDALNESVYAVEGDEGTLILAQRGAVTIDPADPGIVLITAEGAAHRVPIASVLAATVKTLQTQAVSLQSGAATGDIEFKRLFDGAPVFTVANQNPAPDAPAPATSGTIYWPWIIDARAAIGGAALDEFYMYYSTDHEGVHANSGIWLATAPTELGPWTGRGRVYRDDAGGDQCETPSVMWVPEENLFFMYYQMAGVPGAIGQQSTLLATSPDGRTWTRVGVVLESRTSFVGLGHTGYFRPFRIGKMWYAYHLNGNGTSAFGISYSVDGRDWWIDSNPLEFGIDQTGNAKRVEWNTSDIVWWRGRYWWTGLISDFSSGLTPKDARISTAPISDDFRHILGVPKTHLYPTQGLETTDYRTNQAFVGRDGNLYLYYQTNGAFYAAIAERSAV